jgi:hypothetical protein
MQFVNSIQRGVDAAGQLNSMLHGFTLADWMHDRRNMQ